MKYVKLFLLMFLFVLISPIMVGCDEESINLQLSTPLFVNVINEQETERLLLITDDNPYASSYVFGICEMEEYKNNPSKFLRYETKENYLDVKNIFTYPKTYYFYVQAIGENEYKNSAFSNIEEFVNIFELSTPTLTCSNNVLGWSEIKNVDHYEIYLNGSLLETTKNNSFDINTYHDGNLFIGNIALNFQVKAIAKPNTTFINSKLSNTAKITSHLTPVNPVVSISGSVVKWQAVKNATEYEIEISSIGTHTYKVDSNSSIISVDLKSFNANNQTINLVENVGDYSIKVKAIGRYANSEFSNSVVYTSTQKLTAPQIVNVTKNEIGLSLDIQLKITDENVNAIFILIKKEGVELFSTTHAIENTKEFTLSLSLKDLNLSTIEELTNLSISTYAVQNGNYYLKSNTATVNSSF